MTEYHFVSFPLSDVQAQRLADGLAIRIKHADLSAESGVPIPLTKTQLARILKARSKGVGLQISLSKAQIAAASAHSGGGIFSSAVAKFKDMAPGIGAAAKDLAVNLADQHADAAVGAAANAASKLLNDKLPDWAKPFADMGLKFGEKYTTNQLHHFLGGLKASKNGSGLFAPGHKGGGAFAPVEGGSLRPQRQLDQEQAEFRKELASAFAGLH